MGADPRVRDRMAIAWNTTKKMIFQPHGKVTHGHLGARNIDQPPHVGMWIFLRGALRHHFAENPPLSRGPPIETCHA